MIDILVATHGKLANGLKDSLKMITGLEIETVNLDDNGIGPFEEKMYKKLDDMLEKSDGVLVLVDIHGGSPFNVGLRYKLEKEANIQLLTGVNLSMLIETVYNKELENDINELAKIALEAGRDSVNIVEI